MSGDSHSAWNLPHLVPHEASISGNEPPPVEKQICQTVYEYKAQRCGDVKREGACPISSFASGPERHGRGSILHEIESWGLFNGTLTSTTTPEKARFVAADMVCSGITPSELHDHAATGFHQQPFMPPEEILNGKEENGDYDTTTRGLLSEGALPSTTPSKLPKFVATAIASSSNIVQCDDETHHRQRPIAGMQPAAADSDKILKGKDEENDTMDRPLLRSHMQLTSGDDETRGSSPPIHTVTNVDVATSPISSFLVQDTPLVCSSTTKGTNNSKGGGLFAAAASQECKRRRMNHSLFFQGALQDQSSVKDDDLVSTSVWLSVVNKCYALSIDDDVPAVVFQPKPNGDGSMNT